MPDVASISAPLSDPSIRRAWDKCLATARGSSERTCTDQTDTVFQAPAHQPYLDLAYLDAVDACSPGSIVLTVHTATNDTNCAPTLVAAYGTRRGPLRIVTPPPLTPFSPTLLGDCQSLEQICDAYEKQTSETRITLPPGSTNGNTAEQPPLTPTWTRSRFLTYMVTLAPTDQMLSSWSQNRRRTLDKHAKDFRLAEEAGAHGVVAQLVADSYSRHKRRPPLPVASLTRLAEYCGESGLCRIFVARSHDGAPAAAVAALLGNGVASYWMAGSIPGPSMTVLLAHIFGTLHADGFLAFDFVGANTPSIAEFKRRFGGTLLPYHSVHRASGSARALRLASSLIRRARA